MGFEVGVKIVFAGKLHPIADFGEGKVAVGEQSADVRDLLLTNVCVERHSFGA